MKIFYFISYILIFACAYIFHDSMISLLCALLGLTYTIMAGCGKYRAHIFGFLASLLYAILAYQKGIIASFILYSFYYVPMYAIGFFNWRKNTFSNEVRKVSLGLVKFILPAFILSFFVSYLMKNYDTHPYFDSFIVVFSCFAMYLAVRRALEQWVFWSVVNILSVFMWCVMFYEGEKAASIIVHWVIYLVLGIYYYTKWRKSIKTTSNQQS